MYESPSSLEELCLDAICDNIMVYIECIESSEEEPKEPFVWKNQDKPYLGKIYQFKDPELFLFNEISENLMAKFIDKGLLCDGTMFLFNSKNTKLKNVRLRNCKVGRIGLKVLKQHNISKLECSNLEQVSIVNILDCLNDWTLANMTDANFSKCTFIDLSRHSLMVKITTLKNLRYLNLACTELNQMSFQMICEDLKFLEKLDISNTSVRDLRPLIQLSDRLIGLSISDLATAEAYSHTIRQLKKLRYLDVSMYNEKLAIDPDATSMSDIPFYDVLADTHSLPDLVSLDISGWRDFMPRTLVLKYVKAHPKLRYLGCVLNDITFGVCLQEVAPPGLIIGGLGDEKQIRVALVRYRDRPNYVQKALYHLFQLTNQFPEPRPDMFDLVLPVMAAHPSKFGVQMAATACLYNLTRGELSKKIHPRALGRAVGLTLYAMEVFPAEFQLQKNSLLTLCSDTILQDINFDRFRCAKLVLDALCSFEDVNMNRMAVAICSILAAKVSSEETSALGARPTYMEKLLAMVQNRVDSRVSDITLKFTLSALWNLTDESAATCTVFLDQNGAHLFLNVLKTFKDDSAIETKVLGLLNNIAEVTELRHSLMLDSLMNELFVLLKSENIDVSYFAAGIVAHLASDGYEEWNVASHSRNEMLRELEDAVSQWKVPDNEMVAYRSFRPFFSLLRTDMDFQVQLWAVWAIHHVCTKNPKRYCFMLQDEKGHLLLDELIQCSESHPDIKMISSQILETVAQHVV